MDISQSEYDVEPDYEFVNSIEGQYSKTFNVSIPKEWLACENNEIMSKHRGVNLFKKTFLFNLKFQNPDSTVKLTSEHKITLNETRKVAITGITVRKYIAHGKEPIHVNIYPDHSNKKEHIFPGNVDVNGKTPSYVMLADGFQFEGNDVIFKVAKNNALLMDFPDLSTDTYLKGCERFDSEAGVTWCLSTETRSDGAFKHVIPFVYNQIAKKKDVKMKPGLNDRLVYIITDNEYNQLKNQVYNIVNDARMDANDIVVQFNINANTPDAGGMMQLEIYYSWMFDTPKPKQNVRT
jgi:hypothetical protein